MERYSGTYLVLKRNALLLTLRGGGIGLWIIPVTSTSDAIDEILSVERPLERRLDEGFGAGGGGFWGLLTDANLSEFLQSAMTSLFPETK